MERDGGMKPSIKCIYTRCVCVGVCWCMIGCVYAACAAP